MANSNAVNSLKTDNDTYKKLPKEFSYVKYKFKTYAHSWDDQRVSIYAVANAEIPNKQIAEHIVCKNYELLCSMLSLREEISKTLKVSVPINRPNSKKTVRTNTINIDNPNDVLCTGINLNPTAIEKIKRWCLRYGYPFAFDFEKYCATGKPKLLFGHKGHILDGFLLSDFLLHLNEVHYAFQLCRVITGQIPSNYLVGKVVPQLPTDRPLGVIDHFEPIYGISTDRCKEIFASKYVERQYKSKIYFDKDNHAHIRMHADNLFDAAYYELALFLNEPKLEIHQCPICGKFFEATSARQKYCLYETEDGVRTCYAQKVYKRKQLKKRTSE